ncbi:MAG: helix-turn-helix domain-containing protein [Pseudomonadota bacterium]
MLELLDAALLPEDHPALVPDMWARGILFHSSVTPDARSAALAAAGLPRDLSEDEPLKLTQAHEAVLLEALSEILGDASFGAKAGTDQDPHVGTVLSYMCFAAADLREMMTLMVRYLPITRSQSRVTLDYTAYGATIELGFADGPSSRQNQYGEFAVGAVSATVRAAVGDASAVEWISVAAPDRLRPGVLDQIYGCKLRKGLSRFAVAIPSEALDLPITSSDDRLLEHLTAYGDILLARRKAHGSSVLEEVERKILERLSFGAPSLVEIAELMGISPRTLSRRLEREGHTYREVQERLRYELARRHLANPNLPLAEIAFLLGFADQSSFGTAFRRWAGFTPGQYRRTL